MRGLAQGKEPGADTIPTEVYRNLKSLAPVNLKLVILIEKTGSIPKPILEVAVTPLAKPSDNLINMQFYVNGRSSFPQSGNALRGGEAPLCTVRVSERSRYWHSCGATFGLHVRRISTKKYIYSGSLEIEGTFDSTSHDVLPGSLWATQVDGYRV